MYDTLVNYALIGAKHKVDSLKEEIKNTTDESKVKRLKAKLEEEKSVLEDIKHCEKAKYEAVKLFHTKPRKKMFLSSFFIIQIKLGHFLGHFFIDLGHFLDSF